MITLRPVSTFTNSHRLRGGLMVLFFALIGAACGNGGDDSQSDPARTVAPAQATGQGAATSTQQQELLVREDSPILGPADAKVTIVEFLDPECESCRAAHPIVKQLMEEYPDDVRLVVRYFPLHGNSVLAAIATEAAGEQEKYEEMQSLLFERQPEWGEKQTPQGEAFLDYAEELGLDMTKFAADLENPEYLSKIQRDQADGTALGVTGTPTFFVDGQWVSRPSYAALKSAIDARLK